MAKLLRNGKTMPERMVRMETLLVESGRRQDEILAKLGSIEQTVNTHEARWQRVYGWSAAIAFIISAVVAIFSRYLVN